MSKKDHKAECIVLKIGDQNLNEKINDEKVKKFLGSYIYFPLSEIDEEDLEEVIRLEFKKNKKFSMFSFKICEGSMVTVSVKLEGIRKKVTLNCEVESLEKTMIKPGILLVIFFYLKNVLKYINSNCIN